MLQLDKSTYSHNRRILKQYLDATRSSLLFARKVVLVEGLSEKYSVGTLINSHLKQHSPQNNIDIDSEGLEIVEVGGKIFNPFNALFQNDNTMGLNNKCLNLRDGDSHLEAGLVADYNAKYNELNPSTLASVQLNTKKNIYTFEIDCFFLPIPEDQSKNNIEYLKLILYRFMKDGDYFKTNATFAKKLAAIDSFAQEIISHRVDKDKFEKFFDDILNHEVSKPSISLYLSSLLKAKLLKDVTEIETWGDTPDPAIGITHFNDLPEFIMPKYIQDGIRWLITD